MPPKRRGGKSSTTTSGGGGGNPLLAQLLANAGGAKAKKKKSAKEKEREDFAAEMERILERTKGMDFDFGPRDEDCDINSDDDIEGLDDREKIHRSCFEKAYSQSKVLQKMSFTQVCPYKVINPNWKTADYFKSGGFSKATIDWSVTQTIRSVSDVYRARCVRYKGRMVLRKVGFSADSVETAENTVVVGSVGCSVLKPCEWDRTKPGEGANALTAQENLNSMSGLSETVPELAIYAKFCRKLSCRDGMKSNATWANHGNDDFTELTQNEVCFIDFVKVEEPFQGTGAGLLMVEEAHKAINSAMSLTLIPACPFDGLFEDGTMGDASATKYAPEEDDAGGKNYSDGLVKRLKQLYAYYSRIGFRLIGHPSRPGDLFMAHWNGAMSPDIDKVVPHWF